MLSLHRPRVTRARLEYYTIRGRSMLGRVELKRAEKTVSRSSLLCNGKTEWRGKIFKKKPIEVLNNKQEVKERVKDTSAQSNGRTNRSEAT